MRIFGLIFLFERECNICVQKDIVDGGMKYGANTQDLKRAIRLMKENKATDERVMTAEYIKALGEQYLKNLRVPMNDMLSG